MFKELYLFFSVWLTNDIAYLDQENFEYFVQANYGTSTWLVLVTTQGANVPLWEEINEVVKEDIGIRAHLGVIDYNSCPKTMKRLQVTEPALQLFIKDKRAYRIPEITSKQEGIDFLRNYQGKLSEYEYTEIPKKAGYWASIFKEMNEFIGEHPFMSLGIIGLFIIIFRFISDKCAAKTETKDKQN